MRPSLDQYFISVAQMVATRATCDRLHVGAVIVKDKNILATGYNGSVSGLPHCDDVGHMMEDGHCVATIHAEANAILQAAKNGARINNSFIYITHYPCWGCFKLIVNAGIKKIYYAEAYRVDEKINHLSRALKIEISHVA